MGEDDQTVGLAVERGWTAERRERFLTVLSETCHVRAAVAAVGMSSSGLYYLRRRDADFADQWDGALAIGYDRLEQALLRRALTALGELPGELPPALPNQHCAARANPGTGLSPAIAAPDMQLALLLLNRHRARIEGHGGPRRAKPSTMAETDASLRKKLDALARRLRGDT